MWRRKNFQNIDNCATFNFQNFSVANFSGNIDGLVNYNFKISITCEFINDYKKDSTSSYIY